METIWQRLSWPQVVALAVLVVGVVAILIAVPIDKLTAIPWEGVVGVLLVLLGGSGAAAMGPLVRPRTGTTVPPPREIRTRPTEPPPPPDRRGGFVDVEALPWLLLWTLAAGLALAHALSGCGGAPRAARAAVLAATEAVALVDETVAPLYAEAAAEALERASTLTEYHQHLALWDGAELALRVSWSSLRAADAALDAWDAGGSERWLALAGCVATSLAELLRALDAVGVRLPPELATALALAASIGAPVCGAGPGAEIGADLGAPTGGA